MWTDVYTPLRILGRGLALILLAIPALIPAVLGMTPAFRSMRIGEAEFGEVSLNWWTRLVCRIFGVSVRTAGDIESAPVLIVANHISWFDIIALHSAAAMGFVSKAEVANWPLIGFMARMSGTVFHERGSHDSSSNVASAMIARLKEGHRVAIFPEGGITPGDRVKVFHARLFKVAIEAGCPVQPVMIRYMRNGRRDTEMTFIRKESFMANFMRLLGRPSSVCELHFLQALDADGKPRRTLANEARAAIEQAFEANA